MSENRNKYPLQKKIRASEKGTLEFEEYVITKEAEKKAETYMECTTKLIPVIRGSIGTLSKSFKKYLKTIQKEQHQVAGENNLTGQCANTPDRTNAKL